MVIYPTGTCFDDALEYIEQYPSNKLLLVHGILTLDDGKQYAHAWVEDGVMCWDAGVIDGERYYYQVPTMLYYAIRGLVKCTKYTVQDALEFNVIHESYGPWLKEYYDLCIKRK